ncbi:hemin uptake protein HemP [Azonexus sp.]|uniref:hemin uptake protein HemP n=1 Tax=Azonexus sp. TaxID=1872668 RepID=UPI0035AD8238
MEQNQQTLRIPFLQATGPRGTLRLNRDKTPVPGGEASGVCTARCISSDSLFGNCNEICIRHCGADYRLRITRQDKLILTK